MKTLIFPGQGSQSVGMGKELYKNFDLVKKIFRESDDRLKYPISKIILEGPESDLKLTKNTQPAILTVSYSIFKLVTEKFNIQIKDIKYFAGHSLGEYTALVSSKSLNFSDAVFLLHERGKYMQEAVPTGKGAMLAVMGQKINDIQNFIDQISKDKGVCEIANDNSEGQTILSGDKEAIDEINKILKANKKKINFFTCKRSFPLFFDATRC